MLGNVIGMTLSGRFPILSSGKQEPGSGKVCAEQAVNWLVSGQLDLGDETDHPSCVQPVLNALAIAVNDKLPDSERHRIWPVILRQPGTARPEMEPMLSVRLALWIARQVEHLGPVEVQRANDATEAWIGCPCELHLQRMADADADAADADYADYAVWAADAANAAGAANAANAANADRTTAAIAAAFDPVWAAHDASDAAALELFEGAQVECERLIGHVPAEPDTARLERLGELVGFRSD